MLEKKPCPVDRRTLIVGLACCSNTSILEDICSSCPYYNKARTCIKHAANDALTYILYLEEQLNAKADGSE